MTARNSHHNSIGDPSIQELVFARPWLRHDAMAGLLIDQVPLARIADTAGTPTWVYSAATLRARYRCLTRIMADTHLDMHVHYAVKANDSRAILSLFHAEGAGADVVSGGELRKVLLTGFLPGRIVYSGVGKSEAELRLALQHDIGQINVESAEELAMISGLATGMQREARVVLRVNPNVDAGTNEKITTGRATDKFGIPYSDAVALYAKAATLPCIRPVGLAVHIGSQIQTLAPYRNAFARIADLVVALRHQDLPVDVVDCGGGLGISYCNEPAPSPAGLATLIKAVFHDLDVRLMIEPGRWLVGPAGVLLATVLLVKQTLDTRFVVLDAAMNDLMRPALYDAWHGIIPVSAADAMRPTQSATIVGPVCETTDTFARNRQLPPLPANARVAVLDAGAYGAVMSSTYNARPLAAEAWIDGDHWLVIRDRQPVDALWAREWLPA